MPHPAQIILRRLLLASALTATPAVLSAQTVIHSTYGPGMTYLTANYGIDGTYQTDLASPFQLSGVGGATLYDITFTLIFDYASQGAASWGASVWQGPSMSTASLIESWTGAFSPGLINNYTVSSTGSSLSPGQTYWFALSHVNAIRYGWHASNNTSLSPSVINYRIVGTWYSQGVVPYNPDPTFEYTSPVFEVRATMPSETVPEPATMTLLATGLAGIAAARRKRGATRAT